MQHNDTHLVLRPDSDFFRYFSDPDGKTAAEGNGPSIAPAPGTSAAPSPQRSTSAGK